MCIHYLMAGVSFSGCLICKLLKCISFEQSPPKTRYDGHIIVSSPISNLHPVSFILFLYKNCLPHGEHPWYLIFLPLTFLWVSGPLTSSVPTPFSIRPSFSSCCTSFFSVFQVHSNEIVHMFLGGAVCLYFQIYPIIFYLLFCLFRNFSARV